MPSYEFLHFDDQFVFDVVTFAKSNVTIDDDHLDMGPSGRRTNKFINPVKSTNRIAKHEIWRFAEGTPQRSIIIQTLLDLDNIGETHTRYARSVIAEISVVGGFASVLLFVARQTYLNVGKPFRHLNLGVQYS